MSEVLRSYINTYASTTLTDAEFEIVMKAFTFKRLRRKQYLLQEGDVCKFYGFILKGAMRQYSVDAKGTEYVINLGLEESWVGDRESFFMLTPSRYNIDAWEDTDLLLITNEDFQRLLDTIPAVVTMVRVIDQRYHIATQRRLHSSIAYTARERYEELANTEPELIQRFPQQMIASYLGISPETLSRIRRQGIER
ncbi:Crp/Fnr family transcriptional regulator [Chitinophaga filiformis]|uniref:Crp/Fnr family transcriptional regulator n=1 Tax=Chitinophaga filiformis TaxID=104663 RepID=A0ABY4HWR3_CHIFI|nr:Crp/Fnr family transcriptional regulator [Chitinophaga filiformis]UPK68241.1 Crp/Fnr family transcriptional regulator [Chitinophaga filiformis]